MSTGGIITDPTDRAGLWRGSVIDWVQTVALAPLLGLAVLAVGLLAADSRRRRHTEAQYRHPRAAAARHIRRPDA